MTEDYNFIYQFDGNLTDDTGKTTWTVDSGTPSYVAGDNGQALVGNSAALSTSLDPQLMQGTRPIHFVMNLRFNTGGTDGNIVTIDTGSKTMFQLNRVGSTLRFMTHNANQTSISNADETMTLDTWLCWGVSMWVSTSYRELEPGTTGSSFTPSYSSWDYADFGSDIKFLIGQTGNASGTTNGPTTVATGVDIDFFVYDSYFEGSIYTTPLSGGYDPRSAVTFPTTNLTKDPVLTPIKTGLVAGINRDITSATQVMPTGGGGVSGPVIKEFWS